MGDPMEWELAYINVPVLQDVTIGVNWVKQSPERFSSNQLPVW